MEDSTQANPTNQINQNNQINMNNQNSQINQNNMYGQKKQTTKISNQVKIITAIIILILLIIGVLIFIIMYGSTKVSTNFIEDDDEFKTRTTPYYIDETVIVHTKIKNFASDKSRNFRLTYGMEVINPSGQVIESLSEPRLFDIVEHLEEDQAVYHFTARIPTLNFEPGDYTIVSTITDNNAGDSYETSKTLSISYPDKVMLAGPYFSGMKSSGNIIQYDKGSPIIMTIQARGYMTVGTLADLELSVVLLNKQGELIPELSDTILNLKQVNNPGEDVFNMPVRMDTSELAPDIYNIMFIANDKLGGESHSVIRQVSITGG